MDPDLGDSASAMTPHSQEFTSFYRKRIETVDRGGFPPAWEDEFRDRRNFLRQRRSAKLRRYWLLAIIVAALVFLMYLRG